MDLIKDLPLTFSESQPASWSFDPHTGLLTARAKPQTDLYCDPKNGVELPGVLNALTLLSLPCAVDFQISSKVQVQFISDYDAGALLIWSDPKTWAKLCFEYSPDQEFMVVSVVTLGTSDDANSFTLTSPEVWFRISRIGAVYAFHASSDAKAWRLIRVFTLGEEITDHRVGFVAQAPVGTGCEVAFQEINFSYASLSDLRDGS